MRKGVQFNVILLSVHHQATKIASQLGKFYPTDLLLCYHLLVNIEGKAKYGYCISEM